MFYNKVLKWCMLLTPCKMRWELRAATLDCMPHRGGWHGSALARPGNRSASAASFASVMGDGAFDMAIRALQCVMQSGYQACNSRPAKREKLQQQSIRAGDSLTFALAGWPVLAASGMLLVGAKWPPWLGGGRRTVDGSRLKVERPTDEDAGPLGNVLHEVLPSVHSCSATDERFNLLVGYTYLLYLYAL